MSPTLHAKPRCSTINWKSYNAALRFRGSLIIWLDNGMSWFAAASGKRGLSPVLSSSWEKVNGSVKSMALRGGASGASLRVGIDAQRRRCGPCVTSNHISDAAVVPNLLGQLLEGEPLLSVTGEGAYDTAPVYSAVMKRHAMPILRGDHRHSWVEIKMHCIQRLGEKVMSRTFERQINELHI